MSAHPEKWYILLTPENYDEVTSWWLKKIEKSGWPFINLNSSHIVLSEHPFDISYYWGGYEYLLNEAYPSYKPITIEQFRQITNQIQNP